MRHRREDADARSPRRASGRPTNPSGDGSGVAARDVDAGAPRRPLEAASADCTTRVADVLKKMGYGFAVIPHGNTGPGRA